MNETQTARTINTYRIHYFYQDTQRSVGGVVIVRAASELDARRVLVNEHQFKDEALYIFGMFQEREEADGDGR